MEALKKIILVDDHVVVRNGLRILIEKLGPYHVIAEYDNGEDLLAGLEGLDAPDLLILDLSLPAMQGEAVVRELKARQSSLPVLILTLNRDEAAIVRLFRNGVRGYLPKDSTAQEMRMALEDIFRTGYYHNEFLTLSLTRPVTESRELEQERILSRLTPREREFLALVCHEKEYTYEQIADHMGLQHRTVDGYRQSIFEKFGIRSKTGLVLFVLKHRLFDRLLQS